MTRRRRAHRYSNIACSVISVVGFLVTLPWQEVLYIWNEGVPVFSVQTTPQIMVGNLFAASLEDLLAEFEMCDCDVFFLLKRGDQKGNNVLKCQQGAACS